jgi:hypothetical protein
LGKACKRAVVDGTRAVADAFATFQVCANAGVCFPALHFFEGADPRVFVVEAEHKTQGDFVVFQVVQKATAKGVVVASANQRCAPPIRVALWQGQSPTALSRQCA